MKLRPPQALARVFRSLPVYILLASTAASAQKGLDADVVVLADTSNSMTVNDPKNTVVLVTRLFADIVPGKLSAVRLINISKDSATIPHEDTGEKQPCPDRPNEKCNVIKLGADALDKVIDQRLLVGTRPSRGNSSFKLSLVDLLNPAAAETKYEMSWAAIDRLFHDNASPEDVPRVVVWLSDGDADDWNTARLRVQRLIGDGVAIRALIFKTGKTEQVKQVGIDPNLVDGSPHELMKAFADAFRYIVQAPFRTDGVVATHASFTIKPHMENVWVVMYGDESLTAASITRGGKTVSADYASDRYNGSAYRVAYLENPEGGEWEAHVTGGGPDASYAVIQRSTITPVVDAPADVITGVAFPVTVTLRSGQSGSQLNPSDLPEPVKIEALFDGQTIPLNDDGTSGDAVKGDGKFTALLTAHIPGALVIQVHAHNSFLDRTVKATVNARGYFRYSGGPVDLDFGSFKAGMTVCRVPNIKAEQQGSVPFELRPVDHPPGGVRFELRAAGKHSQPGGEPINLMPGDEKQLCLIADRAAGNSRSDARIWVNLSVRGQDGSVVPLRLTWAVRALTFWERWGKLILLILLVLLVFFIIYGYIKPYRFPPGLSIAYAPAIDELNDQTPQPIRIHRGVGIGFYRDARACLQESFRINGQVKGALAILQAGPRRSVLIKTGARPLYREIGLREWEQLAKAGRRVPFGEIYRVGESGPYFRLSMRGY